MPSVPVDSDTLSNWPATLVDDHQFRNEQTHLAQCWTLLGLKKDVAKDGDWFRASLGTRSVFVQRWGEDIKAFENRCAHRSFPLRTTSKGNGPVICGFHHWRYDRDGRAVGIPMCLELFGRTPRQLDARLNPVEIASCGSLIFGRFGSAAASASLEDFLGASFPILAALSEGAVKPQYIERTVQANWRLCYHTSVEDYHIVAVHPATFGKGGYLKRENISYYRFGDHSAYFYLPDPEGLGKMAAECRDGTWRSANYRVFHIFPNLTVSHFRADRQNWWIVAHQYVPLTKATSLMRAWIFPAPFTAGLGRTEHWFRRATDPVRARVVRFYVNRVLSEDNAVCEKLQQTAGQILASPILGGLEERLAWFEEAYAKATQAVAENPV